MRRRIETGVLVGFQILACRDGLVGFYLLVFLIKVKKKKKGQTQKKLNLRLKISPPTVHVLRDNSHRCPALTKSNMRS